MLKAFMIVYVAMHKRHTQDSRAHGLWLERRFHSETKLPGLQEGQLRVHTCCEARHTP